MAEEKEHPFSSDLMYHLAKENGQYQTERDEALKKVAELEKKLAAQQDEQQQQQPEGTEPRYTYGQPKHKPFSISFGTGPETAADLF
jgi:hypothetical protein